MVANKIRGIVGLIKVELFQLDENYRGRKSGFINMQTDSKD